MQSSSLYCFKASHIFEENILNNLLDGVLGNNLLGMNYSFITCFLNHIMRSRSLHEVNNIVEKTVQLTGGNYLIVICF